MGLPRDILEWETFTFTSCIKFDSKTITYINLFNPHNIVKSVPSLSPVTKESTDT